MGKITTSIPKLDELLEGGITGTGSVLILTDPMVDKATFAQQIVSHRIGEGDSALYLTTAKLPSHIIESMKDKGWKTQEISWIDCISHSLQKEPTGNYSLNESITEANITSVKDLWNKAIGDVEKPSVAVFDCLDTFMSGGVDAVTTLISESKKVLEKTNTAAIYLLTDWGYPKDDVKKIQDAVDTHIILGTLEKKATWLNYFSLGQPPNVFFKTTEAGVSLYVPKILITGDFNAGKSSTVKALSERSVSIDRMGTTIALDHGYVERKGMAVDIFGTPGQERFDWLIKILSKDTWGIILVVDSTKKESFGRAKKILETIEAYNIPTVVFANKQDDEGATSPEEIGKELGIKHVIGTSATKNEGCTEGLKMLFDEIMRFHGDAANK